MIFSFPSQVVNRVQKLRKKAGLVASDAVDVFLDLPSSSADAAADAPASGAARLARVVEAQVWMCS